MNQTFSGLYDWHTAEDSMRTGDRWEVDSEGADSDQDESSADDD